MVIFYNHLISISSYALSIHVNLFLCFCQSKFTSIFFNLPFSISFYSTSINVNPFLSSCQSRSMAIFSNHLISISSNPTSIHLNLFLSLRQSKFTTFFLILPFLSHSILHLSTSIFFYLLANLGLWLSFPII